MYEKTQKRKNKNRLPFYLCSFLVRTNAKTEKRQMTSFLSFFLLCTKTHKNIQTEIDFRSIVFRCKYDQSMKERTGYNLIFCLYFFRLLWLFKGTKNRDREGSGRDLSGGWSRCCWSAVFITVVCVFFCGSFKNGGDGKRSYCPLHEGAC